MWIGTDDGLNKYLPGTGEIFSYYSSNTPGGLSSSTITALEMDEEGYLWVGTPQGLNRFNPETKWFHCYYLVSPGPIIENTKKTLITTILNDSHNRLWIGTREFGLFFFNRETHQFENTQNHIPGSKLFNLN